MYAILKIGVTILVTFFEKQYTHQIGMDTGFARAQHNKV